MGLRVCEWKGVKCLIASLLLFCSSTILAADSDGDGFDDLNDAFPNSPAEFIDFDSDGVGDNRDAFPFDSSRQYLDLQGRLIRSVSKDCVEGELL